MADELTDKLNDKQSNCFMQKFKNSGAFKTIANTLIIPTALVVGAATYLKGGDYIERAQFNTEDVGEAYAGQKALPADKYNPKGPEVSEANFKQTIAKDSASGYVWVMYDAYAPNISDKGHKNAERFWNTLKERYDEKVEGFIRIDATGWSNNAQSAVKEITKNWFPSFVLYHKGSVVNDGTPKDIRIIGPPNEKEEISNLEYLKLNCPIK